MLNCRTVEFTPASVVTSLYQASFLEDRFYFIIYIILYYIILYYIIFMLTGCLSNAIADTNLAKISAESQKISTELVEINWRYVTVIGY